MKNLDTGETVPLSLAEEKLPKCINPMALQIMRLTSEYTRYFFFFLTVLGFSIGLLIHPNEGKLRTVTIL